MNDSYYTERGERPELAALEVNPPEGYIGKNLMPIVPVREKTGVIYYATVTADAAAQTGRAAGTAPTSTQISTSNTTFTAAEAVERGAITPDEVKSFGSIEKADLIGAKWAKRQVMNAYEGDVRDIILGSGAAADASFDAAKFQTQVQDALQTTRLFEGRTAMVASTRNLRGMLQEMLSDPVHGPALARLVGAQGGPEAVMGLNVKMWMAALALWFGVDEVMAGDDTIWNAAAVLGRLAVVKYDDGSEELSHKYKAILGKTWQFMPDGVNPWVIQTVDDRVNVNNLYDAYLWYNVIALNSAATYVFDGIPQ
jgi:hypothetical protein